MEIIGNMAGESVKKYINEQSEDSRKEDMESNRNSYDGNLQTLLPL